MHKHQVANETKKMRSIILKLLREHAKSGKSIGMADPKTLKKLSNSLEKDPTGWFAAGMQLYHAGFITYNHYQILQGQHMKAEV